jgi:general secretion pathway protein K
VRSALPRATAVNVNTATPEVLASIIEGLDLGSAQALVAYRDRGYFRDAADFTSRLPRSAVAAAGDIGVSSDYFIATLHVTIGGAQARGKALFERGCSGWPTIVWRKYL